ncbi:unnamed protein product [Symbiodinium natans]|uniref:Uncharacterized protein n=1 Tax=Symbiodinium natans TaxID=878477 RepID=A0A812Q6E1_9DINO|nr:unnamed protein product [Symbiodinium natans]
MTQLQEVQRFFGCQAQAGFFQVAPPQEGGAQSFQGYPAQREPVPIVVGAAPGKPIARSDSEDDLAGWER